MGIVNFLLDKENFNLGEDLEDESSSELNSFFDEVIGYLPDFKFNELPADRKYPILNNMFTIYSREMDVSKSDATAEEFADWISASGTIGEFIFEFRNDLALKNLETLALLDKKFVNAVYVWARRYGYIDKENRDTSIYDEVGKVVKPEKLIHYIFSDSCRTADEDRTNDHFDEEIFNDTIDDIEEIYDNNLTEEFEEAVEEAEPVETPTPVEVPAEEGLPEEVVVAAHSDIINSLINGCWNLVSELNAAIATIEYDFKGDKEAVVTLLNDVVDTTTINIGMLHKVSSIVDAETADLIATGEAKAEEKIGE